MIRQWTSTWLLLTFVSISYQISNRESTSYTAAVVEFSSRYKPQNVPETLLENAEAYVEYIKNANKQNADIIVFPEDGVTSINLPERSNMDSWSTTIPSASEEYVPCTQNTIAVSEALKKLSCAAKENRIYVVVNIAEKFYENECSSTEVRYYNTNVVFDRDGKIIARYRKTNLYIEPNFDTTESPEIVTFQTDFGVTFGVFTCFDILFQQPALNLTRVHGITDFVYPTAWFSEVPFLTAVQTQFGWAYAENVNLLASGYNRPTFGNTGSGIYLGRKGSAKAIMSTETHDRLLIFRVPKMQREEICSVIELEPATNEIDSISSYDYESSVLELSEEETKAEIPLLIEDLKSYETISIDRAISERACHENFCCDFEIRATSVDPNSKYRIAVFNGTRYYGPEVEVGSRVCALVQCANDTIASCGSVQHSETVFSTVKISATFDDYEKILVMPSVLNPSLVPFTDGWTYNEYRRENQVDVVLSLNHPTKNLATFGIYSRDFSRDHWE